MRGEEAPLRVNPEPLGYTRGLELVERQTPEFMLGSRRVDFSIKNIINEVRKAR
jgi:hypothetical protein